MGASAACHAADGGVRIDIEVVPGASDPGFPTGFNPWRSRVQARLAAPPQDGEANQELVERVAAFFDVGRTAVDLTAGHATRKKTVMVRGVALDAALARLDAELAR